MTSNPFWDFSLAVYARPDVAPCCLALQDRHGVDVNILLWAAWCGLQGLALSADAIMAARVEPGLAAWREEVVRPLRRMRRELLPPQGAVADQLAAQLGRAELEAERLEQDGLFRFTLTHLQCPLPELPMREPNILRANLRQLGVCYGLDPFDNAWMAPFIQAIFPGAGGEGAGNSGGQ